MGRARERQHEEAPRRPAATTVAGPAPPGAAGLAHALNGTGVIALQRLVGNAAVAEMIETRRRSGEPGGAGQQEQGGAESVALDGAQPAGEGAAPAADGAAAFEPGLGVAPLLPGAPAPAVNGDGPATELPPASGTPDAAVADAAGGAPAPGGPGASLAGGTEAPGTAGGAPSGAAATTPSAAPAGGGGAPAVAVPGPGGAAPAAGAPAGGGGAAGAPAAAGAAAPGAPAAAAAPGGPAAPGDVRDPHDDPNFKAMKGAAKGAGARAKTHQPAAAGAATAQGAAAPPGNDVASQAAAAQVDEMGKQQPGVFDRQAFIAAVKKAIDAAAPKNLEEADDFKGSGKVGQAKDEVQGLVKGGKKESEKNIKQATDAPPDTSKATPKPVTPMVNDEPGAPPGGVGAAAAMPGKRPPEQTDLSAGPAKVDATMQDAGVTDEQLKKSNEPEFTGALEARDAARQHSATAPGEYRAQEQDVLARGRDEAEAAAGEQLAGIQGARVNALGKALGHKNEAKGADEGKRAKVATDIQGIYDRTKGDVTKILDALDGKVDAAFTKGEQAARTQFESYVDERMRAYKDDRYSGWTGGLKWAKDKLFGMPDEVNRFYEQGRSAYLAAMDGVIGTVADLVGAELTAARTRIADGRAEVHKYVAALPADLREVGKEAEGKLESQFEQLSSDVDSKQDALVDTLAQKYVASRDALDARIDELQAANKGFVDKAIDAVAGVVKTILKLKDMLMNVLARAASVIGDIIADPIGFLGNLVDGVKGGLSRFVDRIGTHLQDGLMGWLFGALGNAGLTMPKALDFAGILDLVLQVVGLTYQNVRSRLAKAVGEPLVARMEKTVDVIRDFATKGIAGAWEWIKDKIGDLEDMVLGQIKEFIASRVIRAGITWIISLLNPAAAFIKACKAIYDIVMFIVERGAEIMDFVNSVLDSIGAIAKGSIGVVVEKVEGSLAKALPLAISFLASLLGLGGISEKIRSIIDAVRGPINKAIDFVVGGAVKTFKKMFGGAIGWAKGKLKAGKEWVKGKVEAGKAWARGKVEAGKQWVKGKVRAGKDWAKEKVEGVLEWWKARKSFTGADGERHALYFEGQGPGAVLTVASAPAPVYAFLTRIAAAAAAAEDTKAQHASAMAQARVVDATAKRVERSKRDPATVDELNDQMLALADLLKPLVLLLRKAGAVEVAVGDSVMIQSEGKVAVVTKIDDASIEMEYVDLKGSAKGVTRRTGRAYFVEEWGKKFTKHDADRRQLYMGHNPDRAKVAQKILDRMQRDGKYDPATRMVSYARDAAGRPLKPGDKPSQVLVEDCDLGHLVDAVVWWNSNGRFTGIRSTEVRAFMEDPANYEFEPSEENQARGRERGRTTQYLPPAV